MLLEEGIFFVHSRKSFHSVKQNANGLSVIIIAHWK